MHGEQEAYNRNLQRDLALVPIAIAVVSFYIVCMLGSCSPMHCRVVAGLGGIICIGLAYTAGCSVMFAFGGQASGMHNLIPCLLIGIGADDIFVIANAIDQTPFSKSPGDRIADGIKHAGPSITITSLTIALAFLFASMTSLVALKSFCQFACVCVVMLYLIMLTIFTSIMVWDTERVHRRWGDCCGICFCSEETILCCRAFCLSNKQKEYSNIKIRRFSEVRKRFGDDEGTDECDNNTIELTV